MRRVRGVLTLPFLLLLTDLPGFAGPESDEIDFRFLRGHLILVEGTLFDQKGTLRIVIDTGASHSVVNEKTAKRSGLYFLPGSASVNSFGNSRRIRRVILRGLRLGPMTITIPCYAAKLPWNSVDIIVGLDILRRTDFTIDYASSKIRFGPPYPMPATAPMETGAEFLVIVLVRSGDRELHLAVDTGAERLTLFRDRVRSWITRLRPRRMITIHHGAGNSDAQEIVLPSLVLGVDRFKDLPALLLNAEGPSDRDGVLSPTSLGLRRIAFHFSRSTLSWQR